MNNSKEYLQFFDTMLESVAQFDVLERYAYRLQRGMKQQPCIART